MSIERKIIVGLIILVCMLGIAWTKAFAFPNEPTGFRGHKWGTAAKDLTFEVEKVKSIKEIKVDVYRITKPSAPHLKELIVTLDGKMAGLSIKIEGEAKIIAMAQDLLKRHGRPTEYTEQSVMWKGNTSIIEFVPDLGLLAIGSLTGMESIEALLEWYAANIKKQAI